MHRPRVTNDAAVAAPRAAISPRLGGWSLMVAAVLFWFTWFLMPEPGTVDAAFILRAIADHRREVLLSAILQTACAIALIPGAIGVPVSGSRLAAAGLVLTLAGALGNAADAVYHQMAYEMTAPDVDRAAMLPVMTRMQTEQVRLLAPLLLAFFPGAVCLCMSVVRRGLAPRVIGALHAAAAVVGACGIASALMGISPRPFSLSALGLFSLAIAGTGWALRHRIPTNTAR